MLLPPSTQSPFTPLLLMIKLSMVYLTALQSLTAFFKTSAGHTLPLNKMKSFTSIFGRQKQINLPSNTVLKKI